MTTEGGWIEKTTKPRSTPQPKVQPIICTQCSTEKQMVLETTDGLRIGVGYDGFIPMPSAGMWHPDTGLEILTGFGKPSPRTEDTLVCLHCGAEGLTTGYALLINPFRACKPEQKPHWNNGVAGKECHCRRFYREVVNIFGQNRKSWRDTIHKGEPQWTHGGHCPDCGDELSQPTSKDEEWGS